MLELERHVLSAASLRCVSHKVGQTWYGAADLKLLWLLLQGLFPPGQGATIGVDFMIKTVEIKGEKVKVRGKDQFI